MAWQFLLGVMTDSSAGGGAVFCRPNSVTMRVYCGRFWPVELVAVWRNFTGDRDRFGVRFSVAMDEVTICTDVFCHVRVEFAYISVELALPDAELLFDDLPWDGGEIPQIYAHIAPGNIGEFLDAAVTVTVKVPGAVAG